jgi:calcium-dependent protein kinase
MKPENILFTDGNHIKLIDFGLAKICKSQLMSTKLGTPYFISPEVLSGAYDKRTDLWSIGVITYILLSGEPPFYGESTADVFKKIKSCDYDFH